MKPNDKDMDELLRNHMVTPDEEEVKAAQRRLLAKLQARHAAVKSQYETIQALRKVELEGLNGDDLVVLQTLTITVGTHDLDWITERAGMWFYKDFSREAVEAALSRLEAQNRIHRDERHAFSLTHRGRSVLERGTTIAKGLIESSS